MPKISIVIPTIEEPTLFPMIKEFRRRLGRGIEIIVVDKSSEAYFRKVKATGVVALRQTDKGVENAIMQGLRAAKGEIIGSIDADGTHEMAGILKGIQLIKQGKADLVMGNRMADLKPGAMSTYLKFGNFCLSLFYSIIHRVRIHDFLTGLFVIRKSAFDKVRHITPYRAGNAGAFAIEFAQRKYKITEVPISYYPREHGESKLTKSKIFYGVNVASHIVRMARDYNPLLIFGGIGVVLIIIGAALGLYVIYNFLATGAFTLIGRAFIAFTLVIVGILSIIAGFILDLLLEIEKRIK